MIEGTTTLTQGFLGGGIPSWLTQGSCHWSLVRRSWRALCSGSIYYKSENWLGLTLGGGLSLTPIADMGIVKIGALVAAAIAHTTEATALYRHLQDDVLALKRIIWHSTRQLPPALPWVTMMSSNQQLSPSLSLWWRHHFYHYINSWQQVAIRCCKLAWRCLNLVNSIAEIADALSWEPEAHSRNIRELFINVDTMIEGLAAQGPHLVEYLRSHRTFLDSILETAHSPIETEEFLTMLENATTTAETISSYTIPFKEHYSAVIVEIVKRGITGAAAGAGYIDMVPDSLLPQSMKCCDEQKLRLPYPSPKLIRRASKKRVVITNILKPKSTPPPTFHFVSTGTSRPWSPLPPTFSSWWHNFWNHHK